MNGNRYLSRESSSSKWERPLFLLALLIVSAASAEPFKFGVMGDTQWTYASDAENSNSVAVSIIKQVNEQCIKEKVKFVVQVGDITDNGRTAGVETHAVSRQELYDAGIGFYTMRGNHEWEYAAAHALTNSFPQNLGLGPNVLGATGFSSPNPDGNGSLNGLSYTFQYGNAQFVMLDQFTRLEGTNTGILDQIDWVDSVVSSRPAGSHAFVFAHKVLIGANHTDTLFGSSPTNELAAQDAFIGSMNSNAVGYVIGGHDHLHQRSLIASPNGLFDARQIICASDSSKFYKPLSPSNDETCNSPLREISIAQDLYRIGYYIFTVDGPNVMVEYYASEEYFPSRSSPNPTPELHFTKRETFGYSLNGHEFLVAQEESYAGISDSIAADETFLGTTAMILDGNNNSTVVDGSNRSTTKCVATGWAPAAALEFSDVLHLLGMADVAAIHTESFVLEMTFDATGLPPELLESGVFALCSRNAYGRWIRAVDANVGGTNTFVFGAWNGGYELGTYGVDASSETVWAVINHNSEFAATITHIPAPGSIAGDFQQHSLHTDGAFPMQTVFSNAVAFGLNWWANSEYGGSYQDTYRWEDIGGYSIPTNLLASSWEEVISGRRSFPAKTILQGVELNCPGHEHVSAAVLAEQYPEGAYLNPIAQFEYLFDAYDDDLSGGPDGTWLDKNTNNVHQKAVEAVAWLQENYPMQSWFIPSHPERRGVQPYPFVEGANAGYSAAAFRDLNNAGPDVCFGFESMPGRQKAGNRGGYGVDAAGGGTYGGTGIYAAQVGGLWDALLGEGRAWWLFTSSGFHDEGRDFWPGEFQKTYSYVDDIYVVDSAEATQQIVDSLRSGRGWVVQGDLIDALDFTAAGTAMGSQVFVIDDQVPLSIMLHDPPGTNSGPVGHNTPMLDHIDLIAGEFGDRMATNDAAYNSASNTSCQVVARFDATGGITDANGLTSLAWTDLGDGWREINVTFDAQGRSTYFRLRGSNQGLDVPNETDGAGNPLADALMGSNTVEKAFDDLWFYSNPVFVEVNQPPTVSLTSPSDGEEITEGYSVSMAAEASDDSGVASVSFFADGNLIRTDSSSPFTWQWTGAAIGLHDVQVVALDAYGLATASGLISIRIVEPEDIYGVVSNKLTYAVGNVNDDAEENRMDGMLNLTSSDLELSNNNTNSQIVGIRFTGVSIPKDTIIASAYIQFTCSATGSTNINPFSQIIYGEDSDSAEGYAATVSNITSRAFTGSTIEWSGVPDWEIIGEADLAQRTPNLKNIVQEIISRDGWVEGSPIAFMLEGQGGRSAASFDSGAETAARLVVVAVQESTSTVAENSDDAEEVVSSGLMDLGSSDLEIVQDNSTQAVGVRFSNVILPDGPELVEAYIQFTCASTRTVDPFNINIHAEDADNPLTYSTALSNVTSRTYTAAQVNWTGVPAWLLVGEAGRAQRTPNLKDLVLEVVARKGWLNGNAMAFKFSGEGCRNARSRESGEASAPRLVLVYAGSKPDAPQLERSEVDGRMIISWPVQGADGYRLQFTPSLTETNWVMVGEQGFFRLIK